MPFINNPKNNYSLDFKTTKEFFRLLSIWKLLHNESYCIFYNDNRNVNITTMQANRVEKE